MYRIISDRLIGSTAATLLSVSDPFKILGIQAQYDLDQEDLHRRFIHASAQAHPDHFIDSMDQADAAKRSAQINEAYRLLKDPESRASALLEVLGGPAKEADQSLPPDLLMEVMEAREQVEEAIASGDKPSVDQWTQWAVQQRQQRLEQIAQLFDQARSDPGAGLEGLLSQVRLELNALRYFQRMINQTST